MTYSFTVLLNESPFGVYTNLTLGQIQSIQASKPSLDEASKKNFILIRHGFSEQNLQEKEVLAVNPNWTLNEVYDYEDIFTNEKYLDSRLHEIGVHQCMSQQENINSLCFSTVFVSPLRRTIQTCLYMFATHPERKKIKFILLPHLAECLCSSGCFSPFTLTSFREEMDTLASSCDITLDYSLVIELGHEWQIKVLQDPPTVEKLFRLLDETKKQEPNERTPYHQVILNEIKHTKCYVIEDMPMLYKKSLKAKEILQEYQKQVSDGKIGVVSHAFILKCFTGTRIEEDGSVKDGYVFHNAEILPFQL